ncbi:hypothetical protein SARC_03279 [Sphaeroforma arctica JP610]|uniref:Uncharacterized protein n=1 Tax=Sphaeroforma arctica JP610 TaxID=667725 RepID=A0A0L0G647_9EUKA|nr:hypothetical protein SARC_03279 [Sphaeroforma arctica JP610]KNC84505.1 hypothetical protein SARC_03279 [Sphaeroforma arctica JP610]|eukprot:XP_014158407.1 hypothetical protein SARC_03279 [Sphaeroforma arctica JP610]
MKDQVNSTDDSRMMMSKIARRKCVLPFPVYVHDLDHCKHNMRQKPTVRIRKPRSGLHSGLLNKLDSANVALVTGDWSVSLLNVETRTYNLRGEDTSESEQSRRQLYLRLLSAESISSRISTENVASTQCLDTMKSTNQNPVYSKKIDDNSSHSLGRDSAVSLVPITMKVCPLETAVASWLTDTDTKKPVMIRMKSKSGKSPVIHVQSLSRSTTMAATGPVAGRAGSKSNDIFYGRSGICKKSQTKSFNTGSAEILNSALASHSGDIQIEKKLGHLVVDFSDNYATPPVTRTKSGMKVIKIPARVDKQAIADETISIDDRIDDDYWLQEDEDDLSVNCTSITARSCAPIVSRNAADVEGKHKGLNLTEMLGEDMTFIEFYELLRTSAYGCCPYKSQEELFAESKQHTQHVRKVKQLLQS